MKIDLGLIQIPSGCTIDDLAHLVLDGDGAAATIDQTTAFDEIELEDGVAYSYTASFQKETACQDCPQEFLSEGEYVVASANVTDATTGTDSSVTHVGQEGNPDTDFMYFYIESPDGTITNSTETSDSSNLPAFDSAVTVSNYVGYSIQDGDLKYAKIFDGPDSLTANEKAVDSKRCDVFYLFEEGDVTETNICPRDFPIAFADGTVVDDAAELLTYVQITTPGAKDTGDGCTFYVIADPASPETPNVAVPVVPAMAVVVSATDGPDVTVDHTGHVADSGDFFQLVAIRSSVETPSDETPNIIAFDPNVTTATYTGFGPLQEGDKLQETMYDDAAGTTVLAQECKVVDVAALEIQLGDGSTTPLAKDFTLPFVLSTGQTITDQSSLEAAMNTIEPSGWTCSTVTGQLMRLVDDVADVSTSNPIAVASVSVQSYLGYDADGDGTPDQNGKPTAVVSAPAGLFIGFEYEAPDGTITAGDSGFVAYTGTQTSDTFAVQYENGGKIKAVLSTDASGAPVASEDVKLIPTPDVVLDDSDPASYVFTLSNTTPDSSHPDYQSTENIVSIEFDGVEYMFSPVSGGTALDPSTLTDSNGDPAPQNIIDAVSVASIDANTSTISVDPSVVVTTLEVEQCLVHLYTGAMVQNVTCSDDALATACLISDLKALLSTGVVGGVPYYAADSSVTGTPTSYAYQTLDRNTAVDSFTGYGLADLSNPQSFSGAGPHNISQIVVGNGQSTGVSFQVDAIESCTLTKHLYYSASDFNNGVVSGGAGDVMDFALDNAVDFQLVFHEDINLDNQLAMRSYYHGDFGLATVLFEIEDSGGNVVESSNLLTGFFNRSGAFYNAGAGTFTATMTVTDTNGTDFVRTETFTL